MNIPDETYMVIQDLGRIECLREIFDKINPLSVADTNTEGHAKLRELLLAIRKIEREATSKMRALTN